MNKYVCRKCGLTFFDILPELCIVCHSPKEEFVPVENAIKNPFSSGNINDLENWSNIEYPKRIRSGLFGNGYKKRRMQMQFKG
ncbi:MAG: hypothetical protein A2452_13335 [Candidatus Firestonebacteria bacterium RIFOXYC2_FULL_39_67]|nr:MAG: hypothetical protein A2536_01195 [Candidatus Firestonebacteria bacterium RIFOXYD2_FULL_39_29]OGF56302.1 MAG: hypothetical protein A2452_13335 [Candidatus Firestonebacteria bacterium RIFOXYC2_FULL_39_67]